MKITFVMPIVDQNGGSRVVATYALGLRELGHDVTVVSRLPPRTGWKRRILNLLRGRPERANPNRTVFFDPLGSAHVQIDREGPLLPEDLPDADVVVATWWRTAFEVATMPPEKGAKVYFVQHHEVHEHLPWDLGAGSYWLPLKKITISPWLARIMAERYGDADVPVVLNSVDTALFDAPPRVRNSRPVVGFLYAPSFPLKGTDLAIDAIRLVRERIPALDVVSFGYGEETSDLPLPSGTRYLQRPPQADIVALYASCDAWIAPSRAEGFGLPLLEAMACRTPVVATRTGGAESFIEDGRSGYLVEPGDAGALAARLSDLLSLPHPDWRAMSDVAHARVHAWTWAAATREMEAELVRAAVRS